MTSIRLRVIVGMMLLTLCIGAIAGCTGEPPKGPVPPGVRAGTLGGMEVIGYLASDNGQWKVLDADPEATGGSEPKPLATLVPGSVDEGGIEALDGRYVWAAGTSSDNEGDAPVIKVDGIDTAVEPE